MNQSSATFISLSICEGQSINKYSTHPPKHNKGKYTTSNWSYFVTCGPFGEDMGLQRMDSTVQKEGNNNLSWLKHCLDYSHVHTGIFHQHGVGNTSVRPPRRTPPVPRFPNYPIHTIPGQQLASIHNLHVLYQKFVDLALYYYLRVVALRFTAKYSPHSRRTLGGIHDYCAFFGSMMKRTLDSDCH